MNGEMKCMEQGREPMSLSEIMDECNELLERSLSKASLIKMALCRTGSVEIPNPPESSIVDQANGHREKMKVLCRVLDETAAMLLGVR